MFFRLLSGIEEEFDIEVPAEEAGKNYNGGRSSEYDQSWQPTKDQLSFGIYCIEKKPF